MEVVKFPESLGGFIPFLEQHGIDVLWIMPDTHFSEQIEWKHFEDLAKMTWAKVFPSKPTKGQKKPTFVSIRRNDGSKWAQDRYLAFPGHAEWSASGCWDTPTPYVLGQTIRYLHEEFGFDPLWGPGNLGMKLLNKSLASKKWTIQNTELTPALRTVLNTAMIRPVWRRYYGLTDEQEGMQWLHGYDKNAQYLGAAQSVVLGNGQPEWVGAGAFNAKAMGFWKYKILDVRHSPFNGYTLPCPLDVNRTWASTDLLVAAQDVGIEFEILEGVVWAEGKKYLEPWAKEAWQHRVNLRDGDKYPEPTARANAQGTAKLAPNMLMGRLATPTNDIYRPDWNMLIVHKAIANQVYSFRRMLQAHGIRPVLVTTDAFWVVSDEVQEDLAIPGILDHTDEQRGYKHIGTVEMTSTIAGMFGETRPEEISTYLNKVMKGESDV